MLRLGDLEVFVRTAEAGSLTAAAQLVDCSPAVASASLKRLEAELGVRLFARSTRSLRLSREGEAYLPNARAALEALDEGRAVLAGFRGALQGRLRLSVPSDLGRNRLLDWLDLFQDQHPDVELRLQFTDRVVEVFRQPVDVALRYGVPEDSSLVVQPVAAGNRRVLVAAPAYLERRAAPVTPDELVQHDCLLFMLGSRLHDRWCFSRGRREVEVTVRGHRIADDGDAVRRWAIAGQGIACKSWLDVEADVSAGRLLRLLPEWQGEAAPLNLVCADRQHVTPLVQSLRSFLRTRCEAVLAALDSGIVCSPRDSGVNTA